MINAKLKGFTLVECIVALAILGIASLLMAQIYAQVALINKRNHAVNSSLSMQMKLVEQYIGGTSDVIDVEFSGDITGTAPPHDPPKGAHIKFKSSLPSGYTYSYGVDIHVLMSRDALDNPLDEEDDNPKNLRYKYFQGHPHN